MRLSTQVKRVLAFLAVFEVAAIVGGCANFWHWHAPLGLVCGLLLAAYLLPALFYVVSLFFAAP